mgnify:CR=1 FL=1
MSEVPSTLSLACGVKLKKEFFIVSQKTSMALSRSTCERGNTMRMLRSGLRRYLVRLPSAFTFWCGRSTKISTLSTQARQVLTSVGGGAPSAWLTLAGPLVAGADDAPDDAPAAFGSAFGAGVSVTPCTCCGTSTPEKVR